MANEVMNLSVDTGSILVNVDDNGEIIGQFRFNPNDPDIINRFEKVVDVLEGITFAEDGDEKEIFRISDTIKEQFDYLLNYKVSDGIFGTCNPLTLLSNGDFYFENVMEGIGNLIESIANERLKKKKAKIKKATAKYHK